MTLSGSGNHIYDNEENFQNRKKRLPCGCYKRCSCDEDDEILDEVDEEKIKDISVDINK